MTLYDRYKKKRYSSYFTGGELNGTAVLNEEQKPKDYSEFSKVIGTGSALASGIIDATSVADPITGRQSTGSSVGKGALSGLAMGSQFGPIGAGIGAVVGGVTGFISAKKQKKELLGAHMAGVRSKQMEDSSRSAAMAATNPSLYEGYKNSGYFAYGGIIDDPKKPTPQELNVANIEAKRFAKTRGLANAENMHVGNSLPKYIDGNTGLPYKPAPTRILPRTLPKGITADMIKSENGQSWYTDPDSGDLVEVDPSIIRLAPQLRTGIPSVVKLANGGGIDDPKPIPVYKRNDPRLRAYNDSLTLHNAGIRARISNYIQPWSSKEVLEEIKYRNDLFSPKPYFNEWGENNVPGARTVNQVANKTGIKPTAFYVGEGTSPYFKKPVQPYYYQAPEKQESIRNAGSHFSTTFKEFQKPDLVNGKYSYTYPSGGNNSQNTVYFNSEKEWKEFLKTTGSTSKQYGKDWGTATGNQPMAMGGTIKSPLATMYMNGGRAKSLSSDNTEISGNTHAEGGVKIPEIGAELEDGETTKDNFVFSDKLGFAAIHKKIARAKGAIEKKPVTQERINSMKRLSSRENDLMMAQEYLKQKLQIA